MCTAAEDGRPGGTIPVPMAMGGEVGAQGFYPALTAQGLPGAYPHAPTSLAQATADPATYYQNDSGFHQPLPPPSEDSPAGGSSPTGSRSGGALYTCKECSKQFTLKGNLKRHLLTHAGVKPFKCHTCNKGFSRKADLEIHQRVHTGEKPYPCPHVQCGKRFARISDLRSHERTHR